MKSASLKSLLTVIAALAMQTGAHASPPNILQVYREPLKPGTEAAYDALEQAQARQSAAFGCPHPYLAAESLGGPKEVWWFNGYESAAQREHVYDAYAKNDALMEALRRNSETKKSLTFEPIEIFAHYRPDLSAGESWTLGHGRFLVIAVVNGDERVHGTVYENPDGTLLVVRSAATRQDADAVRARAGAAARFFAVRPSWSFPDEAWVEADEEFWARDSRIMSPESP